MGRILLVEDDFDIRTELAAILVDAGFQVSCAGHGEQALRMLREGERPSVILLDLRMPVMDGWAFRAEQLADAELARIPVLLLTAGREAEQAAALGVAGVIGKPFSVELLLRALRPYADDYDGDEAGLD